MSTKELAVSLLNSLDEDQLLDFLRLFADDNTLALAESEVIANNPDRKHYNSFEDILNEVNGELVDE